MIKWYVEYFQIPVSFEEVRQDSLTWAIGRGNRSGRTAFNIFSIWPCIMR